MGRISFITACYFRPHAGCAGGYRHAGISENLAAGQDGEPVWMMLLGRPP